jgi:hypothetical protein
MFVCIFTNCFKAIFKRSCMGECKYSSIFLDLGTRWSYMASFTPLALYFQGMSTLHPLDRKVNGPRIGLDICGVEIHFLTSLGIKPCPSSL